MPDTPDTIIAQTEEAMKKAISHLEAGLVKIRAGKASPSMIESIMVDYYGNPTPINQIGNISVLDATTLSIQPWEKNMLQPLEKSIMASNIDLTRQTHATNIR